MVRVALELLESAAKHQPHPDQISDSKRRAVRRRYRASFAAAASGARNNLAIPEKEPWHAGSKEGAEGLPQYNPMQRRKCLSFAFSRMIWFKP